MANRSKSIVTIYDNNSIYIKTEKIFTTTPNVIIIDKHTHYKQSGNNSNEIKRIVNGNVVSRSVKTIVFDN